MPPAESKIRLFVRVSISVEAAMPILILSPTKPVVPVTMPDALTLVNVLAAPGADTPLIPVYLAPATYTLLPEKLTPLGRLVPMK